MPPEVAPPTTRSPVHASTPPADAPATGGAACANCGASLAGPYCAQCGQHAHESARALGALLHDAWHTLTHVDGRSWQTLRRLVASPGFLTVEYFRERRARYVPPFRLYLVVSLAFFTALAAGRGGGPATAYAVVERDGRLTMEQHVLGAAPGTPAGGAVAPAKPGSPGIVEGRPEECDRIELPIGSAAGPWSFAHPLEGALRKACRRAIADGGRSLGRALLANVPKMMFVFLPLMALVMRLVYRRPRRLYVEHLVFFLHAHAALFLVYALSVLVALAARVAPALAPLDAAATFGAFLYTLWYVWRAMRRYYGQGRLLTLAKAALVGCAYLAFLGVTLTVTTLVSALAT